MKELIKPYWSVDLEVILKNLDVDPARGLSDEEVKKRHKDYGMNRLRGAPNIDEVLKHERSNLLFAVIVELTMFLAGLISLAIFAGIVTILGDNGLTLFIITLVIYAIIYSYKVHLVFKIINMIKPWLNNLIETEKAKIPEIRVLREGKEQKIDREELVPGDIIIFDTSVNYAYLYKDKFSYLTEQGLPLPYIGDPFAGDARLLESNDLEINEATLTGDPEPSIKDASIAVLPESSKLFEVVNMVFAHTTIAKGKGKAVVVATGNNTEVGKISTIVTEGPSILETARMKEGATPEKKYRSQLRLLTGIISIYFIIILILSWLF
jgi:Ca2+-transporting ATPase